MAAPDRPAGGPRRYGTFEGVFVPTLLTILGVILYLRTGWVVGNAGLLGAVAVILLGYAITGTTAMSIASIATNTPLTGGGAYAIISRSLGLEAGGAVGVPLYLSQTLAVALYVFGFRGGWEFVFPDHPPLVVDLVTFGLLIAIAMVSAAFAFRVQYVILGLIVASLVSVAVAAATGSMDITPTLVGTYPGAVETGFQGTDFWGVFAVFFPATTGIMAGVNLSGELKDSRRSIPLGTLSAVGLTLVVYLAAAWWLSRSATPEVLVRDYLVMVTRSAWGPAVLGGLLGATFSSALASMVGAPRILQALGQAQLLPKSSWFAARTRAGEPRNALLVTAGIALAAIMLRDLNAIAPVITLFFLIAYGTINVVVLIEEVLDLETFRPTLRFPRSVPVVGATGCIVAMVVINPVFAAVAVIAIVVVFVLLVRRNLDSPFSDIRGDVFAGIARWASRRAIAARRSAERGWRPRVLAPVADIDALHAASSFLRDVTFPKGSVKFVGIRHGEDEDPELTAALTRSSDYLRQDNVATAWSVIDEVSWERGFLASVRASGDAASGANIVFLDFPRDPEEERHATAVLAEAAAANLGVLMLASEHPGRLGGRGVINLWIREQGPEWAVSTELQHSHLAILLAYKLRRNWGGDINLVTAVRDLDQLHEADGYLHSLGELARLPGPPGVHVVNRGFLDALAVAPVADASIFALGPRVDFDALRGIIAGSRTPCVFVRDSGLESAFI